MGCWASAGSRLKHSCWRTVSISSSFTKPAVSLAPQGEHWVSTERGPPLNGGSGHAQKFWRLRTITGRINRAQSKGGNRGAEVQGLGHAASHLANSR